MNKILVRLVLVQEVAKDVWAVVQDAQPVKAQNNIKEENIYGFFGR